MQQVYNLIIISHDEDNNIILDTHSYEGMDDAKKAFLDVCDKWKEGFLPKFSAMDFLDRGYGYAHFTDERHMFLRKESLMETADRTSLSPVSETANSTEGMTFEQALQLADELGLTVTFSSERKVSGIMGGNVLIEEKDGSCIAYDTRNEFLEYMAWRKEQGV